jgi:hypothetical protein
VPIENALFLTGAQRSGTTLLAKLLDAQPAVSMLSQPFPLLFVDAKRAFLQSIGAGEEQYPLGHLFQELRYTGSELTAFLASWRIAPESLAELFARMDGYSGQYTKFTREQISGLETAGDFATVVARLQRALSPRSHARWYGSKETTCEELVPYLLDRGFRCVIVVRDPRDMVASLNHGLGTEYAGSPKPTWFNVRSWRKSVAHVLALEGQPRFHWCRYEDVVADPARELTRLSSALELDLDVPPRLELQWSGNSSYGDRDGISAHSVRAYRDVLSGELASAVEAACLPELQLLGYETALTKDDALHALKTFAEPYEVTRAGMDRDRANAENARVERERLERIASPVGPHSSAWFLFERAHARLREAFLA